MVPARCSDKKVKAYRQEPDVAPDSDVETYVAMQLEIDNWRWAGVPFYIRTGKHMTARNTEIAIRFKQAPYSRVPGHAGRRFEAKLAGAADRTGRGHLASVRGQAAWAGHGSSRR